MFFMINMLSCILFMIIMVIVNTDGQTLFKADFTSQALHTTSKLWNNFVGISSVIDNVAGDLNSTLYQDYMLNSNVFGDWQNNWAPSFKPKLGWKHNCTMYGTLNPNVTCTNQYLNANSSLKGHIGQYIWNTASQPYWCMFYDWQFLNLSRTNFRSTFSNFIFSIYYASHNVKYCLNLVDFANEAATKGYVFPNETYTVDKFIQDFYNIQFIIYGITYAGPGISQTAGDQWLHSMDRFASNVDYGVFTVRCVVFQNSAQATIQNLLNDNYTKGLLQRRFKTATKNYSNFDNVKMAISDLKLMEGNGKDGVTNTLAAAFWIIDLVIQFALMNTYEIDFNHQLQDSTYFQGILTRTPQGGYVPTPLYYGLLFCSLMRHKTPTISIPQQIAGVSSKIKIWGLRTQLKFKVVIINKDMNSSIKNDIVNITIGSSSDMECYSLKGPNLTAKDGITLGGYTYVANNAKAVGTFQTFKVSVTGNGTFQIPISYAQTLLCQTTDPGSKFPDPPKDYNFGVNTLISLSVLLMMLL